MSVSVRTATAIALAVTMSSLARATVLVPVELPELTSNAAVVVRGTSSPPKRVGSMDGGA